MSNHRHSAPEPIAVDPAYRLRDNQFWYSDCGFADTIAGQTRITLRIAGLGVRVLTHASSGKDGRPTLSFTLPSREDRIWWKEHRGERISIELLSFGEDDAALPAAEPADYAPAQPPIGPTERSLPSSLPAKQSREPCAEGRVLCIGLDIAWFGGSAGDNDSQYDCLAAVLVEPGNDDLALQLGRVPLVDRDPEAVQLLEAVDGLLQVDHSFEQVIFALDAPIQAELREHFDTRTPLPTAGMVERRACDNWLSVRRQEIDREAGGANGWHPNIQPGAPLAPRVERLLDGLVARGFDLWKPDQRAAARLVIECFPAEAIWSMKRMGHYPAAMTAAQAKAYKSQQGHRLDGEQIQTLVNDVLYSFSTSSVGNAFWNGLVSAALAWMLQDRTWRTVGGFYRGGKLLDDAVDTMICLATSLSYLRRQAHVWFDPNHPNDGHIIGPGFQDGGRWVAARPSEVLEGTP